MEVKGVITPLPPLTVGKIFIIEDVVLGNKPGQIVVVTPFMMVVVVVKPDCPVFIGGVADNAVLLLP